MPTREYYQKHKVFCRDYNKNYLRKWKKEVDFKNTWDARHPEYARAKNLADRYIKEKQPCVKCGNENDLQKHHPDYNKPLDIVWLCRLCHAELHTELRLNQ